MSDELTNQFSDETARQVSRVIRARRTRKVLAQDGQTVRHPHDDLQKWNLIVSSAIADGGFAPFHYDRKIGDVAEPWRFHVIWRDECRLLGQKIPSWFPELGSNNKLPAMLSACGCLVLINWLPQFEGIVKDEKQMQIDEEHLAATAAATQSFLLSLTANNLGTYWSSGGFFRRREMFQRLGIPLNEKLLSAVFIDYGASGEQVEIIVGKQNSARSDQQKWTQVISADRFK